MRRKKESYHPEQRRYGLANQTPHNTSFMAARPAAPSRSKTAPPGLLSATPTAEEEEAQEDEEQEDLSELREVFDRFDVDGSGTVTYFELVDVVKAAKLDMTNEQIEAMMDECDPDSSGGVDFSEFVRVLRGQGTQLAQVARHFRASGRGGLVVEEHEKHEASYDEFGVARFIGDLPLQLTKIMKEHHARVVEVFAMLDEDGDGKVTVEEFVRVVRQLGLAEGAKEEDVSRLFSAVDVYGDGSISLGELQDVCSKAKQGKRILREEADERRYACACAA